MSAHDFVPLNTCHMAKKTGCRFEFTRNLKHEILCYRRVCMSLAKRTLQTLDDLYRSVLLRMRAL